ncbi:TRAP transporter substrate-binding protein [Allopusillimonas ginsengisoli]|uniref:TRAP transporter substrate-binding protein n=1 Tax=Allopusillimonas ginsengisoli TaxID=453575 RepID=UPI0010206DB9|nr:TRAP transporter substrate-binding protein [Allopusillimonas ginsengisoli]TEA79997.1 TRAP transporter substrate-binding protein [Allopusillimonas ginsengisoli]
MNLRKHPLVVLGLAATLACVGLPAAAATDVTVAYVTAPDSPQGAQVKHFIELVNKEMPGQFNFKVFPSGQLGTESSGLRQLQVGTLDMANLVTPITEAVPKMGIFDLPFLFKGDEHARRALTPELRDEMRQTVEGATGLTLLGIYDTGFRQVISKRPIHTVADMAGVRIRVPGGALRQQLFKDLGANPTPIDWTETYTALQTGVVDGVEAAIYGHYEAKLYQVAKNLVMTNHAFSQSYLTVSKTFWNKLTDEQKKQFRKIGQEMIDWSFDYSIDTAQKDLDVMKADGLEINEINQDEFRKRVDPIYSAYIKKYGDSWVKAIDSVQ